MSNANSTLMIQIRSVTDAGNVKYKTRPATPEEIKEAMPDAMHWLPMTDDAVFDRSESMLFRLAKYDTTDASGIYHGTYLDMVETYRPFITHYARITEPK